MSFFSTTEGRIILSFIVIIFLIFGVVTYTYYQILAPQLIENQLEMQTRYAEILCRVIQKWKKEWEDLSAQIALNDRIQNYLRLPREERMANQQEMLTTLQEIKKANNGVLDLFLLDSSRTILCTNDSNKARPYLLDRISSVEREMGAPAWDSGYDTNSMMLYRAVNNATYHPTVSIGSLFIQIDNDIVLDMFDQYRLYNGQRFSLKGLIDGFEITEQGFFYNYYDNYTDLIHVRIDMGRWYLRTWSKKSVALETPDAMLRQVLMIVIISCVFSGLFGFLIARRLTKPISCIREVLRRYGLGDFSAKVEIKGKGEMVELAKGVNDMSEQISNLFDMVKQQEKLRRQLELQTLLYQINPHFLYNTLDSINAIARSNKSNKNETIVEIVTSLSRLFRLGLHQGEEFVSVRDEVAHVNYYLNIQKIRFSEQLMWEVCIDEKMMEFKICKFILQPIAENAIFYGIKSKECGSLMRIIGKYDEEIITFVVEDYGEGMKTEELAHLRTRINSKNLPKGGRGYGLWNVNQRLKLYYGDNCGIQIYSTYGKGTRVVIELKKEPMTW